VWIYPDKFEYSFRGLRLRHFHPIENSPRAGQPLETARFGADFLVRLRTDAARWKASRRVSTAETLRSSVLGEFSTEHVSG